VLPDGRIKGIVGTVPVGADGSVAFRGPADVPLMFQLLDENKMAVMTMRSQTHVRPGETIGCVGCHESRHTTAGPAGVLARNVLALDPPAGPRYEGGLSFVRTVQPVLDRYCIRCHGLEKTEGHLDLLGTPTTRSHLGYELGFNVAYESLIGRPELIAVAGHETYNFGTPYRRPPGFDFRVPYIPWSTGGQWVALADRDLETTFSTPRDYYAHAVPPGEIPPGRAPPTGRVGPRELRTHRPVVGPERAVLRRLLLVSAGASKRATCGRFKIRRGKNVH
jgi:hypothetical protein